MSNVYGYVDLETDDLWNRIRRRGFLFRENKFHYHTGIFKAITHGRVFPSTYARKSEHWEYEIKKHPNNVQSQSNRD